ncbi:Putative F-box protein [Morus notabilis]|uniref:Putative F-box protein n=1 Tax=Morus notabilis TaxID=981085 RepID=W9RG78_9ROSA|nr:Putative F-box protein [Morus notabilis]
MAELMDFPKELVVEIMSFLPAESLVRFKCVCKLWYSIINDRGFVAKNLRNANKMSSTKFCVAIFLQQHTDEYFLSSQCNGVFCLLGKLDINDVMLCNPTTREFKLLQGSCFGVKTEGIMFGFGYDPSVDSYKVVRAVLLCSGHDLSLGAEVYTLGTSSWREIKFDVTLLFSQLRSLTSSMACGQNVQRNFEGEPEDMPLFRSLAIWNESVALIEFSYSDITRPIDIWACCGSRASCCWTKQVSIGPLESIFGPILFWKGDELLVGADDGYLKLLGWIDKLTTKAIGTWCHSQD